MNTLIVPALFIFLGAIMLWFLIAAPGIWWIKAAVMAFTLIASEQLWEITNSCFGHPKSTTLESMSGRSGYLFWATIEEPSSISLWVRIDGDSAPEVYSFSYDRDLHKLTVQFLAQIMANDGQPIRIQFSKQENKQRGPGGQGHGKKGPQGPRSANGDIDAQRMPYIQPIPTPPSK